MYQTADYALTGDDILFELRVMLRWCHLFRKTDEDWVATAAKRFRDRYPLKRPQDFSTRAA